VQRRQLDRQAPGDAARIGSLPGHADVAGLTQRGDDGDPGDAPVRVHGVLEPFPRVRDRIVLTGHVDTEAGRGDPQSEPEAQEGVVFWTVGPQQSAATAHAVDGIGRGRCLDQADGAFDLLGTGDPPFERSQGLFESGRLTTDRPPILIAAVQDPCGHHERHHGDEHQREGAPGQGEHETAEQQRCHQQEEGECLWWPGPWWRRCRDAADLEPWHHSR
jgi:hypothetical protein